MNPEILAILNQVKSGDLSVEVGAIQLQELELRTEPDASIVPTTNGETFQQQHQSASGGQPPASATQVPSQPVEEDFSPGSVADLGWWKNAWLIPFWAGTGILVLGAILMGWAYSSRHFFWFYCSWLPLLLGILVLFLGWWSQHARWVHIRVNDADGKRVAISMPLPLNLTGWALRVFGRYIPHMEERVLENMPDLFHAMSKEKSPMTVEVDEKDGSRVRVYIL